MLKGEKDGRRERRGKERRTKKKNMEILLKVNKFSFLQYFSEPSSH